MGAVLVVGAGITGGYIAARLCEAGVEVYLLARGERAEQLQRAGLKLRDGIRGDRRTVMVPILQESGMASGEMPGGKHCELVMVCVQEQQRLDAAQLAAGLAGGPPVWFLGNTVQGFAELGRVLGPERVLGGFPGVGGTREGDELVYADRRSPRQQPFAWLIIGEAFPQGRAACRHAQQLAASGGFRVRREVPIVAWHLCHAALVLPLAELLHRHNGTPLAAAEDRPELEQAIAEVRQNLRQLPRLGCPVRPRSLRLLRYAPLGMVARKLSSLLQSRFAEVALAGHARTAREEMQKLSRGLELLLSQGSAISG